jgi:phosphate starvation-inducible PhoH-like protein
LVGKETRNFLRRSGYIKDKLVNFARGCTFGNYDTTGKPIGSVVIIDEAQNFNKHELVTLLTRLGEGSIIVCLADTDQLDIKLNHNQKDSITDAIERLGDLDGIGVFQFTEEDIVRDPFLKDIIKKYKN